ncbi:MAG: (deoxy)nucleoside triphosphate pyrophosphohydrolase [Actinomycetaceae bacterium]|nr:(deoxy)nucleoside triphosphate pyrophosphohydrolase [Actinomycetaceae bacterium]
MESLIFVVGAVVLVDGRILVCRRASHKSNAGLWEFPGGKISEGEAPSDALVREIREELGVHIRVGELLDRSQTLVEESTVDLAVYWATLLSDPPVASTDHDELRWVLPKELKELTWTKPDLPAVWKLQHLDSCN